MDWLEKDKAWCQKLGYKRKNNYNLCFINGQQTENCQDSSYGMTQWKKKPPSASLT